MAAVTNDIDWQSSSVKIFLNPRWPSGDYQKLFQLAEKVSAERNLSSHIWVATSGSTAENISGIKLVALSKGAFLNSAAAVNLHLSAGSRDIWAQVLPSFHVGGLGIEARSHLNGAKIVNGLCDEKWDAQYYYNILKHEKCTLSALVPTQVYDLIQKNFIVPPNLRAVIVGGGVLSIDLYIKARRLGWPLLPSYGMTETCSQIATASLDSLELASDGELHFPKVGLLSHAQVRQNGDSFLEVHSNSLLTCYAQISNNQMKHWDPKNNNWFTTEDRGDLVDGALGIEGRGQDYIKIGGEAVLLSRLREKLEKVIFDNFSELSREFALIEMPSERLENEIYLIFTKGIDPADASKIRQMYDRSVLPYEKIRQTSILAEIPRSELGKILYTEIRKRIQR